MEALIGKGLGGPLLASAPAPLRVLVLDGHHPLALAAVRSLGRRHGLVTLATPGHGVPAALSRYCHDTVTSPMLSGEAGARWLREHTHRRRFDVLLYFESQTAALVSTQRLLVGCPLPTRERFLALTQPETAGRLAAAQGIESLTDAGALQGPCHDYALLALVRRGEPVATFMHRLEQGSRHADIPWFARPALESADRADVRQAGLALLARSEWHGVATLGFRYERRNDRLVWLGFHPGWSDGLDLGIACGIDLPWLYAQLASNRPITGPTRYRVGLRYRRLCAPRGTNPLLHGLRTLSALHPDVRTDLRLGDPLPHLLALEPAAAWLRPRRATARPPAFSVVTGGRAPE